MDREHRVGERVKVLRALKSVRKIKSESRERKLGMIGGIISTFVLYENECWLLNAKEKE